MRSPLYVSGDAGVPGIAPPPPPGSGFSETMLRRFGSSGYGLGQALGIANPYMVSPPASAARARGGYGGIGGGGLAGGGGIRSSQRRYGYGSTADIYGQPSAGRAAPLFNPFLTDLF